jgi:isoleucyl-tRNA synthetase
MEIKDTLNLPKTDFPMKANLSKKEVDRLKKWSEQKIYHLIREKLQECPK